MLLLAGQQLSVRSNDLGARRETVGAMRYYGGTPEPPSP